MSTAASERARRGWRRARIALGLAAVGALGRSAVAEPVPPRAATLQVEGPARADVLARLAGQRATPVAGGVRIDDAGGEGPPWVGTVARRADGLWLIGDGFAWRLTGPLARARVAGPGYAIWVTGALSGDALAAHRLGVLRRP